MMNLFFMQFQKLLMQISLIKLNTKGDKESFDGKIIIVILCIVKIAENTQNTVVFLCFSAFLLPKNHQWALRKITDIHSYRENFKTNFL